MVMIRRETEYVAGLSIEHGGSGDPSPATARGVMAALRPLAERLWGDGELAGRKIAVQGVGKVGTSLVERLTKAGATVIASDVNDAALENVQREYGATIIATDEIWDVECDVFSPCAMGGSLNEQTIPRLRCEAVVGSANNQLATPEDAERLVDSGITYVPDFVANAGGVINIAHETGGYDWQKAAAAVDAIAANVVCVFDVADRDGVNPVTAAVRMAETRIETIGGLKTRMSPGGDLERC